MSSVKISFGNKIVLKADTPSCCSVGLSIPILLENLIPYDTYTVEYSSIGPGSASFASASTEIIASASSESIDNIVYLEGSESFVIKARVTINDNGVIKTLSEDILGIDCGGLPPAKPSPTPTSTVTKTPTQTPTKTPTNTPTGTQVPNTPTPTPTTSVTASVTPTITVTSSNTPTPTPTASVTPTISVTPSVTPSITPTLTPSPTRGLPKISIRLGNDSESCGSDDLVIYTTISGLLPNTTYKYALNLPAGLEGVPNFGTINSSSSGFATCKNYLIYQSQLSNKVCGLTNYPLIYSVYLTDNTLLRTYAINLTCDSTDCHCPNFTISGTIPVIDGPSVTPTPTREALSIPGVGDLGSLPRFLCPSIITKKKLSGNKFVVDLLSTNNYEINLTYSFYGSPEKLSLYDLDGTELYNSGYIGTVDKDDNNEYLFCAGIDRKNHTYGTYDTIKIPNRGSRYIVCILESACDESTEWKISFSCAPVPTPTPTSTVKPCPPCPSSTPAPTTTPTSDTGCSYRFNNFVDSDARKEKKFAVACSDVTDTDLTSPISIDKPIDAAIVANTLLLAGSSICVGVPYTNVASKISLSKIKNNGLDISFGVSGSTTHSFKNDIGAQVSVNAKKILPQGGKFLVVSYTSGSAVISRHFASTGSIDTTFGNRGFLEISAIEDTKIVGIGDALIVNNNIILFLETYDIVNKKYTYSAASISGAGRINTSFGTGGIVNIDAGSVSTQYQIKRAAVIDQKLLVVAQNKNETGSSVVVVSRINLNGSVDTSFYNNGTLKIQPSDLIVDPLIKTEPLLKTCLINNDGIYLAITYTDSNMVGVCKYKYQNGKDGSWKLAIPQPYSGAVTVLPEYDASMFIEDGKSWYVGYNIAYNEYAISDMEFNSPIPRKGPVTLRTVADTISRNQIPYSLDPEPMQREVLQDISDVTASYARKSYRFVIAKYNLSSGNTTPVLLGGPETDLFGNQRKHRLSAQNIQSETISALVVYNNKLYIVGFGGNDYNYSFRVARRSKDTSGEFTVADTVFGNNGYVESDFDYLCNYDIENIEPPMFEDNPCEIFPTPTPTQSSIPASVTVSSTEYGCSGGAPRITLNWLTNKASSVAQEYIARIIVQGTSPITTVSASALTIPAQTLSGSINISLANAANFNNQICQIQILKTDSLDILYNNALVLNIPSCN